MLCVRAFLTAEGVRGSADAIATGLTLETLSQPIDAVANAGPLDRLRAAAATGNELRGLCDALLDRYVQAARADGCSWADVGAALGVSQAGGA